MGLTDNITTYLSLRQPTEPEIVLLMAGINDVFFKRVTNAPAGARLTNLVNILKAQRPSAKILVASLLPTEGQGPEDTTNAAVRAEINTAAATLGNASSTDNVYFVDMASVPLVSGDFAADAAGTPHLSASGAQKVAQRCTTR